jgi:hypothetical protein
MKEDVESNKQARKLDEYGVQIMNYLQGYGDDNTKTYNENTFNPYLSKLVVDTKNGFVKPELISNDFITSQDVKALLTKKFKINAFVKTRNTDINKMVEVAENLINKLAHPI